MGVDCSLVITSKVKPFCRPDQERGIIGQARILTYIVDTGSCFWLFQVRYCVLFVKSLLRSMFGLGVFEQCSSTKQDVNRGLDLVCDYLPPDNCGGNGVPH